MKLKTYHILYRLFAWLADITDGFAPFVRYKILLGTVILSLSVSWDSRKTSRQNGGNFYYIINCIKT